MIADRPVQTAQAGFYWEKWKRMWRKSRAYPGKIIQSIKNSLHSGEFYGRLRVNVEWCNIFAALRKRLRKTLWQMWMHQRDEIDMNEILVSVIIPAHNCANFIHRALDSALAQDVPLEVIVVNDCSKDDLDAVMQAYLADPRIRYLKNETNLGAAGSRNCGVREARGEYVAFLDADDYWAPEKLKKQLARMEQTDAVLCSTARELVKPDGTLTGYIIPVKTEFTYRDLQMHNEINCSSVLMKTQIAREFPMHNDECHEDYLMWLEVLQKYGKGCAINEPLLKYRVSNTGKSGSKLHSAKMTYLTYRNMGFGFFKSILCFLSYALHGVRKYFFWFVKK